MEEVLILGTVISGVVLGLTELVKYTGVFPNRFLPIVGIVIGLIIGYSSTPFTDLDTITRLWSGLVAGLGATGFYEIIKTDTKGDD